MAFEKYILPEEGVAKMPVHTFVAILSEYLQGTQDGPACKAAIEAKIGVVLTVNEQADITNTLAYITGGSDLADKCRRMDQVYRVCVLAESGVWYGTQELLRTRLNWSAP